MNAELRMESGGRLVPLQELPSWSVNSVLSAHLGTTDYLLKMHNAGQINNTRFYRESQTIWKDVIDRRLTAGFEVCLEQFVVLDWFPRAPGLYYTREAEWAREEAFHYLHQRAWNSPIRDHADRNGVTQRPLDYTVVFTPIGKSHMLNGGIGCIRLKPIRLLDEPYWLMTATSDGVVHSGFPIAVPFSIYRDIFQDIRTNGSVCATIRGILEFVPNPFSRLFDSSVLVPRLYLRVIDLQRSSPIAVAPKVSVAVSFVSDFEGRPSVYASYVTFRPDIERSFTDAVTWMKNDYIEAEYKGKIITDFDQTSTIFPEARLALSKVMDRTVSRGSLAESIELMHAAASVDQYFKELDLREFLPDRTKAQRTKIFISYSHKVERETGWVEQIRTYLKGLNIPTDFEVWDDSRIEPGQNWREEIKQAIEHTRVAILVLTADFLASSFIHEVELPPLLEAADAEGATILCVCGSHIFFSGISKQLTRYQFVNRLDQPLQGLTKSEREFIFAKLSESVYKALGS